MAWSTPLPELLLAIDAKVEWANMTNPFGGGKKEEPKADKKDVANRLKFMLMRAGHKHKKGD